MIENNRGDQCCIFNISLCIPIDTALNPVKMQHILLDFSLTVKEATLIFISGRGSAIPPAKEGKSGFIYVLVKS